VNFEHSPGIEHSAIIEDVEMPTAQFAGAIGDRFVTRLESQDKITSRGELF
jgi:hypothetical protein